MTRCFGIFVAMKAAPLLLGVFAMVLGQDGSAQAQEKPTLPKIPSAPAQPYVIATAQMIGGTVKDLHAVNKLQDLINAPNIGCRVYIQHEADVATNQGEVHDAADDVFLILEGTATYILGGALDAPKEIQPGEWRAPGIANGKEHKVSKGDVLIVPRGTPHRRVTSGQDVTFMLIKSSTPVSK
jgi:mannose-6-phosphate isomerase-like protein (cupin superfamily)